MSGEPYLLCALIPPGSVDAEVGRLKAALFCDHGLASAQSVPPLVPVAFLDPGRVRPGLLSRLNGRVNAGWSATLRDSEWIEGHLYARVESGGVWTSLRAGALQECGLPGEGLFPAAQGFYLGCVDAPPGSRAVMCPPIPPRRFRTADLALVALQTTTPGGEWWNDLHWEIMEERPLRGRRER